MEEVLVKDFKEFYDVLGRYRRDHHWKFRGQSNERWGLIPKVGRSPKLLRYEKLMFDGWLRRAVSYAPLRPHDDWGWLAIAQHYGLPTRMLDWTHHVLAAAFFAVSEKEDADAAIFAYRPPDEDFRTDKIDPFSFEGAVFYDPMAYVPRIGSQAALFTVHGPPSLALEQKTGSDRLHKIIIAKEYREEFVTELFQLGVNYATQFPDLEGLSKHFRWLGENPDKWDPTRPEDAI